VIESHEGHSILEDKKSLKIPKGISEAVNRRADNTMVKNDKMTHNDILNTTQKTKDRATRTPQKPGVNSGAPEG
jgi:hypothetical protein